MKLIRLISALALATVASTSFADTFSTSLDVSSGNVFYGRNNATGAFTDTYSFTLASSTYLINAVAGSTASGTQDLDFSSVLIQNAGGSTVTTFAGNLGSDVIEVYSLSNYLLAPGNYELVVSGVNSATQASYSGNIALSAAPVPEPETYALMLAGLSAIGFMARRRKAQSIDA